MPTNTTLTRQAWIQRTCSKCSHRWCHSLSFSDGYMSAGFDNQAAQRRDAEARLQKKITHAAQYALALCPVCGGIATEMISQHFRRGFRESATALLSAPVSKISVIGIGLMLGFFFYLMAVMLAGLLLQAMNKPGDEIVAFCLIPAVGILFTWLMRSYYKGWESARSDALKNIEGMTEREVEERVVALCRKKAGTLPPLDKKLPLTWIGLFLPDGSKRFFLFLPAAFGGKSFSLRR
jgi:hypothetical protein